jgi:hypothetical protein
VPGEFACLAEKNPLNLIRVMPAKGQDALMQKSLTIARLVGPVLVAIGIGMLANQTTHREMAGQFLGSLPLIYFSGILGLVAGLYILNVHNAWTPDWRSAVTAVGWILTCVGAFRLIAPQFANFVATNAVANAGFFTRVGIVLIALGGFLTFKAYMT